MFDLLGVVMRGGPAWRDFSDERRVEGSLQYCIFFVCSGLPSVRQVCQLLVVVGRSARLPVGKRGVHCFGFCRVESFFGRGVCEGANYGTEVLASILGKAIAKGR